MNRKHWDLTFDKLPRWSCPKCQDGILTPLKNYPHIEEAEYSKIEQDCPQSEPEWTTEAFVALLKCDEPACGEIVSVSGRRIVEPNVEYYGEGSRWESFLVPQYVSPAPHIIPISDRLPQNCKTHLRDAFTLYWVDRAACANRLRIFIEQLMDHFEIPRKSDDPAFKGTYNLFRRIDLFNKKHPGHENALTALRLVGNNGSHDVDIDKETLLTSFELLGNALSELIDEKQNILDKKALEIIENQKKKIIIKISIALEFPTLTLALMIKDHTFKEA